MWATLLNENKNKRIPDSCKGIKKVTTQVVVARKKWIGWVLIMGGMSRLYAPQGQPAHSPGQSEAAPWVMNTVGSAFALQGQKHI